MSAQSVIGVGVVDTSGARGTALRAHAWPPGRDPLTTPGVFRRLFGRVDPTYRRLDRLSRALVIAAEAAGIARLDPEQRAKTALVLETHRGSLETDLAFARALRDGIVRGPLFPYTLPSTCLGELALRHGLRGPTLCLGGADDAREPGRGALLAAHELLAAGEADLALVAAAEVLEATTASATPPALLAIVALLSPGGSPPESLAALARARLDSAP